MTCQYCFTSKRFRQYKLCCWLIMSFQQCPLLYNNPSFIIKSFQYFNRTFIPEGSLSFATYCKNTLLLIKAIIGPMSESACCSIFQSCLESFVVLLTTGLLEITEIVPVAISRMELSPLCPLLNIALTAIVSRVCEASSHSQWILESVSTSTFSLPLL